MTIRACSVCWGSGYTMDKKPCPCGCIPIPSWRNQNTVASKPIKKEINMDRFDLEQDILQTWNVITDIQAVTDRFEQGKMSAEDLVKYIKATTSMYDLKFNILWERFEQGIKESKIK